MSERFSEEQVQQLEAIIERVHKRLNREARQEKATWMSMEETMAELNCSRRTIMRLVDEGKIERNNAGKGKKIEYKRSSVLKFKSNRAA